MEEAVFRPYTPREKQLLALKYTPEQMQAIEAGEEAIPTEHMKKGKTRTDPMRIKYLDDFAEMRPILDRPLEASDLAQESKREAQNERGNRRPQQQSDKPEDIDPHMLRLMQQTGFSLQEIRRIRVKNLVSHRVVNQTRMGKIQSLYFLTIAGNENGMVGVGEGKAAEDEDGRRQAMMNAIRNMRPIARYEERTIYGDVEAKVGASVVQLYSRPPGKKRCLPTRSWNWVANVLCRLRQPLPASSLRAGPSSWHQRPCSTHASITEQDERRQGCV